MARRKKTPESKEEQTPPNDVSVLSPQPVVWDIGGKEFEQEPLRIDRLGDVFEEIIDIVVGGGQAALFDQLTGNNAEAIMPILARVLAGVPKKLPKIVALALAVPKEETYIRDHLRARMAVQIIRSFVVQNEVAALLQDFFELAQEMKMGVEETTKELLKMAPEEESDSTSEESGKADSEQT